MNDTVKPAIVFHLQEPIESITATRDTLTGTFYYQLQLEEPKSPTTHKLLVSGIIALVIILCLWLFTRKRFSKKTSPYNQFKQTDIYKLMRGKGYYSANKKPVFEPITEQETNELCETVQQTFTSFAGLLKNYDLAEKDLQFCCLVKSRLSTLELSEVYCVSQSAIFKRKQKIKELLGFKSDQRTLDAIFEGM